MKSARVLVSVGLGAKRIDLGAGEFSVAVDVGFVKGAHGRCVELLAVHAAAAVAVDSAKDSAVHHFRDARGDQRAELVKGKGTVAVGVIRERPRAAHCLEFFDAYCAAAVRVQRRGEFGVLVTRNRICSFGLRHGACRDEDEAEKGEADCKAFVRHGFRLR